MCLKGQLSDDVCATTARNNLDYFNIAVQLPGGVLALTNYWEAIDDLRNLQQQFNVLIENIILKSHIYDFCYTPSTGLYIPESPATAGLDMLEPLANIKKIHVNIGIYSEDLTCKFNIQTIDDSHRTLEYMGNT